MHAEAVIPGDGFWSGQARAVVPLLREETAAIEDGRELTANVLDRNDQRLASRGVRLVRAARSSQRRAANQVAHAVARLEVAQRHGLSTAARRVDSAAAQVRAFDPASALARGWSITRGADGRIVRSAAGVEVGDDVTTRLADGVLTSTITSRTDDPAAEPPSATSEEAT